MQRESGLVDLEGVGALVDQQCGVDDGVKIHGRAPNRDWNQRLWGKGLPTTACVASVIGGRRRVNDNCDLEPQLMGRSLGRLRATLGQF